MKIKNKIAVTVIPVMLLVIIAINISYGLFFRRYIINQEKNQIRMAE